MSGMTIMEHIEQTVDAVLMECGSRRLRLWLSNLRDLQMDLGQWSGLIFLRPRPIPANGSPTATRCCPVCVLAMKAKASASIPTW